jgi:hypothetical protein
MSKLTLDCRVKIQDISGQVEDITVREVLERGTGATYEAMQMLDEFEELSAEYEREEYLPLGSHLLPQDYQYFLYSWNKMLTEVMGDWQGEPRAAYKKAYPLSWKGYIVENKRFRNLYKAEVEQLIAYQAENKD